MIKWLPHMSKTSLKKMKKITQQTKHNSNEEGSEEILKADLENCFFACLLKTCKDGARWISLEKELGSFLGT